MHHQRGERLLADDTTMLPRRPSGTYAEAPRSPQPEGLNGTGTCTATVRTHRVVRDYHGGLAGSPDEGTEPVSIKWTSYVWECAVGVESSHLLVLLSIADHAGDDGTAFPSVGRLASRAR